MVEKQGPEAMRNPGSKLDNCGHLCDNNPFCRFLEADTRAALCKISVRAQYKQRQVIELDPGPNGKLMLVHKGQAIPLRIRQDGRQKGIECLGEGDIVGLGQLFRRADQCVGISIYVKEHLEVCLFPVSEFQKLCATNANFAGEVIRNLSRRFFTVVDHLENLTLGNGEERILYLVDFLGAGPDNLGTSLQTVAITHEELALLAGINRVTATRVIDNLKQAGKLTTSRGKLSVAKSYQS